MTRSFIIQERIPRELHQRKLLEELGWEILERLEGLDVPDLDLDIEDGWVRVTLSGQDEGIAENLLTRFYGKIPDLDKLEIGDTFKGFITDLGKVGYGIYFKISTSKKDALYPLFKMRDQLVRGKKISARRIAKIYGFINDMALELELIKKEENGVYVALSPRQLSMLEDWIKRGSDILFIVGATPKQIRRALLRTGHRRDVRVVRMSFLSHALVCKKGTQAKGLIPRIGPHLPRAIFSVLSVGRAKGFLSIERKL